MRPTSWVEGAICVGVLSPARQLKAIRTCHLRSCVHRECVCVTAVGDGVRGVGGGTVDLQQQEEDDRSVFAFPSRNR